MKKQISFLFILLVLLSCETSNNNIGIKKVRVKPQYKGKVSLSKWNKNFSVRINPNESVNMQIYFPAGFVLGKPAKTIILLHDMGKNEREWEVFSRVEAYAEKYNVVLVCPNMKNSIYASEYFPETKYKWSSVPGTKFIGENLIPNIKNQLGLAASPMLTSIIGVGSGARGAVLAAELYNDKIRQVGAISGFYEITVMTRNRLLANVYGPYKTNKERWKTNDNVLDLSINLKNSKMILIHGVKDRYYPIDHANLLAIKIKSLQRKFPGSYKLKYVTKAKRKHDWGFWNYHLSEIFEFLLTSK